MSKRQPATTQQLLGEAGTRPRVPWRGSFVEVGFNTQRAKTRLEEMIRGHVLDALYADKKLMSPQAFAEHAEATRAELNGGRYATLEPGWWAVLRKPEGNLFFIRSLLPEDMPPEEVVELWTEEPDRLGDALEVVAPGFFEQAALEYATARGLRGADARKFAADVADAARGVVRGLTSSPSRAPTPSSAASPGASTPSESPP